MNLIDVKIVRQHVIVGVAGMHDRLVHIHVAVAAFLVVAKFMIAENEIPWIENRLCRCALVKLKPRQGHERLVGRTGRIRAAKRPVHQRPIK